MNLNVNEIFYSLQGEGIRAGFPSIFIRLTGCNLTCGFCDTEFESGKTISIEELAKYISKFPCKEIVWTGGEPGLQLTKEIIEYFKTLGYFQAIETNGSVKIPDNIDHITLSPKVAEHVITKNFPNGVTELKYVIHVGKLTHPNPGTTSKYYWLSPQSNGDVINSDNLKHCIKLCLEDSKWKLTLQTQKVLKVL